MIYAFGFLLAIITAIFAALVIMVAVARGPSLRRYDRKKPTATFARKAPSAGYAQAEAMLHKNFTVPNHSSTKDTNSLAAKRKRFEGFGRSRNFKAESCVTFTQMDASGRGLIVAGEWARAKGADPNKRILYIHGGAFSAGSAISHRPVTAQLAKRTGASVYACDYRLMPENGRMASVDDVRAVYEWILENGPEGAAPISHLAVGGDSAGGNLTLMVIAWARDEGLRAADCAFGLSAATDSSFGSPSIRANFDTDIMLKPLVGPLLKIPRWLLLLLSWKKLGIKPSNPIISPIMGNLAGLPPTLLQVSECEMMRDDAARYVNKAVAQGGQATLQTWDHMPHVWHIFDRELEEAGEAYSELERFIAKAFKG
ncbi:MAG: alpha/beta hydrolase [Robiginitomaculum sp.]